MKEQASPVILNSSAPLPDELHKFKKAYIIVLIIFLIGLFMQNSSIWAGAILALIIVYTIDDFRTKSRRNQLRLKAFKYSEDVSYDELFELIQPVLVSKYGMIVSRAEDGGLTVTHDKYMYDVHIQGDKFTLWWRMSFGVGIFSPKKYSSYKTIISDMGIIAYTIQQAVKVQPRSHLE